MWNAKNYKLCLFWNLIHITYIWIAIHTSSSYTSSSLVRRSGLLFAVGRLQAEVQSKKVLSCSRRVSHHQFPDKGWDFFVCKFWQNCLNIDEPVKWRDIGKTLFIKRLTPLPELFWSNFEPLMVNRLTPNLSYSLGPNEKSVSFGFNFKRKNRVKMFGKKCHPLCCYPNVNGSVRNLSLNTSTGPIFL